MWRRGSALFRRPRDQFGAFHNFARLPVEVDGVMAPTSEALYQALRFTDDPVTQHLILSQRKPRAAKQVAQDHWDSDRDEWWCGVRVDAMVWVVTAKYHQHQGVFAQLFGEIDGKPIVEESGSDNFWGAVADGEDELIGANVLGRIWMHLLTGSHGGEPSPPLRLAGRLLPALPPAGRSTSS